MRARAGSATPANSAPPAAEGASNRPRASGSSASDASAAPRVSRSEKAVVTVGAKRAASAIASPSVDAAIAAKPRYPCDVACIRSPK